MLLRRISVKNVRSYNDGEEVTVEIPEGTILFEGDIGSGKSTLLYALEFALFGFSDMRGAHLLSEGRREGHVEVAFQADGKEYTLKRGLKRKGTEVVQDECIIVEDGRETRLSPTDLKQKVVSILKFNEPTHPKAESLVFRYAVFTPQEQMKEILLQNAEYRLQVIRRVLGAQSYQVAAENSDVVAKRVGEISYGLRRASEDLDDLKADLSAKSKLIKDIDAELPSLIEAGSRAATAEERTETEWKRFRDVHEQLSKTAGKIPALERAIRGLESQDEEDRGSLEELQRLLSEEVKPRMAELGQSVPHEKNADELETEHDEADESLQELRRKKAVLDSRLKDSLELVSKGVCPVCGQKIPSDFASSNHAEEESKALDDKIARTAKAVHDLAGRAKLARRAEEADRELERLSKEERKVERDISHLKKRISNSTEELKSVREELAEASKQSESMKEVSESLARLDVELRKARSASKEAGEALTRARTQRSDVSKDVERLSAAIASKEDKRAESRRLAGYQGWLQGFFRPTVEMIEEQTLTQANLRFNTHFQRFFTSLVDDPDMVVRVKEDFSPLFERQGFEQDFEALSGGERTSMALAYRFALNSVVREDISAQTELVILDEPTDGFSKEQVYKMRDLLEELDSRQVILVSHEKELESMADHIFRVEKVNGTSRVSRS